MANKIKIAILFGGSSVEHQISIRSARNIFENIDKTLFDPLLIGISKKGNWYIQKEITAKIDKGIPVNLRLDSQRKEFQDLEGNAYSVDVAFPVLHGTDGEDGSVQGLLEVIKLPCVGSGVLGSAISMNKWVAKLLLNQAKIPTANFIVVNKKDQIEIGPIIEQLGLPLVVKPASLGSSVGVSIARDEEQLKAKIKDAMSYDQSVILEEFIKGREIECAILGNYEPESSLPGEIVVSDKYEFYSFDAKYVDPEAAKLQIPAKIKPEIQTKIRELCVKTFKALHCNDYARVDLFLTEEDTIYINEINTIPGFTNSSMFPKLWEERGIPYQDLITKLINMAIERHNESHEIITSYVSKLD